MLGDPATLLRLARQQAGLSQRALANRAETSQSVVARIELGDTSPTWDTLSRLMGAAGFDLESRLALRPVTGSHMLADVARIRRLTPEARLAEVANVSRFAEAVRRDSPSPV